MFKRLAIALLSILWVISASAQIREFTVYEDRVLDAYLAYYGRPADPAGLEFWADRLEAKGGNLDSIIEAFGESSEFQDRFGSLTNIQLVTNLYDQLFGRAPDDGGLNFYVDGLDSGAFSLQQISLAILDGVQNDDITIVDNKLEFSRHYVTNNETGAIDDLSDVELAIVSASIDVTDDSLSEAISVISGGSVRAQLALSGSQENPVVTTSASGTGSFTLNLGTGALTGFITVTGVEVTAAHLHKAFAGQNGDVIVALSQDNVDATLWLVPDDTILSAEDMESFTTGELYANAHSDANPGGEVRGQLLADNVTVIWTGLSGDNEVPAVTSAASGRAALTVNSDDMSVILHAATSDLDGVTAAHIHLGFAGQNGGVILGLEQDMADMNHWSLARTVLGQDDYAALL